MPISFYPQEMQKSNQLYINAGTTYSGALVNLTGGSQTLTPAVQNTVGSSGVGTGYQKLSLQATTSVTWSTTALSNKYGHIWYAEVYAPYGSYSTTAAVAVTTTLLASAQPGTTQITIPYIPSVAVGQVVGGPGEAYASGLYGAATTVAQISVSGNTMAVTLNNAIPNIAQGTGVSGSVIPAGTQVTFTSATAGGIWAASNYIPVTSTTGLVVGSPITGTNIPASTTITSIVSGANVIGISSTTSGTITPGTTFSYAPSLTWNSINWHNNVAPTQLYPGRAIYEFYTPDAGTTIYGRQVMANLAGA